jgi:hypothetical protein
MEYFYKIDNLLHHGFPVYYLVTEETKIRKATEFSDKYIYYYKFPNETEGYKLLGKFLGKGLNNDYEVYSFENGYPIYIEKSELIYCMLIPLKLPKENGRNLLLIQNFTYEDYPVYVHCVKENN